MKKKKDLIEGWLDDNENVVFGIPPKAGLFDFDEETKEPAIYKERLRGKRFSPDSDTIELTHDIDRKGDNWLFTTWTQTSGGIGRGGIMQCNDCEQIRKQKAFRSRDKGKGMSDMYGREAVTFCASCSKLRGWRDSQWKQGTLKPTKQRGYFRE